MVVSLILRGGLLAARFAPRILRGARAALPKIVSKIRAPFTRAPKIIPKAVPIAKRSLVRRAAVGAAKIGLTTAAFIGAEKLIRKAVSRDRDRGLPGARTAGAVAGRGGALVRGGGRVGILKKLGAVALGAGALIGAEQIAEAAGVRGGAGFIGRRPTAAGVPGFRRRARRKQLMLTKTEIRSIKSVKSKLKRMNKVIGPLGFQIIKKIPGHGHVATRKRMIKSVR